MEPFEIAKRNMLPYVCTPSSVYKYFAESYTMLLFSLSCCVLFCNKW